VSDAPRWQIDALRRSKAQARQHGRLLVRHDRHPDADRYPVLDRVLAFHRAMRSYAGDLPVAVLDPDMVVLRSLETTVEPGWGQATLHPAMERHKAQQLDWLVADAAHMPLLDLPWVMSARDARRLAPVWLEFTERMVLDPSIRSLFGWMLDMWALCAASLSLGIAWDVSQRLTCVPGEDVAIGDAWVLHYHRAPVHGFDKRTWQPGRPMRPAPRDEPYEALRSALE
jgi:hypothetical protein